MAELTWTSGGTRYHKEWTLGEFDPNESPAEFALRVANGIVTELAAHPRD